MDRRVSKRLSYLLRHGAAEHGLAMDSDGYVPVSQVLPLLNGATLQDLERVVRDNDKQRFKLAERDGRPHIRANQGHSLQVGDSMHQPVIDPTQLPVAVHGTTRGAWETIRHAGLSRMGRQHIHMATDLPEAGTVVSGMRAAAEVAVFVDVEAAMAAGIQFMRSDNGVVLSGGIDGTIPPTLFARVVDRATGQTLK